MFIINLTKDGKSRVMILKKNANCEKHAERSLTLFVPVSTGFIYWDKHFHDLLVRSIKQ